VSIRAKGRISPDVPNLLLHPIAPGFSHPAPSNFRNAAVVRYDLGVREVQLPAHLGKIPNPSSRIAVEAIPLRLLTVAMPVTICAFDVKPDPSRQLWYCDIEMDPGSAYYPFVRFALARYQVNSIPGAHLSRVVLADYSQLVPERALSVAHDAKVAHKVNVSLTGTMGDAEPARTTQVEAAIEEANPNELAEVSWFPVPNSTRQLTRVDAQHWAGALTLSAETTSARRRVVIREYEVFQIAEQGSVREHERRLVYVDTIVLAD
jgi:hypothetical protein